MQYLITNLKRAITEDEKKIKVLNEKFSKSIDLINKYIDERDKISEEIYKKEDNLKDVQFLIDFIEKNHLKEENLKTIDLNLMKFILKELFKLDKNSNEAYNSKIEEVISEFLFDNLYVFQRLLEENKELAKDE